MTFENLMGNRVQKDQNSVRFLSHSVRYGILCVTAPLSLHIQFSKPTIHFYSGIRAKTLASVALKYISLKNRIYV